MSDHLFSWLAGVIVGCLVTVAVAVATGFRLLPKVVDLSIVPTGAGVGSLLFASYAALRRYPPDRLGRLTLLGTLLGGVVAAAFLAVELLIDVLS